MQHDDAPRQRIRGVVCRLRPRRYMGELRRTPHSQRSSCRSHGYVAAANYASAVLASPIEVFEA